MYRASGSTAAAAAAGVGGARTPSDSGCSQCGKLGAVLKCSQCRQRVYCDAKCQKKHWKSAVLPHKAECKGLKEGGVPERAISAKLLQVFSADGADGSAGGSSASAASLPPTAVGADVITEDDDDDDLEYPCPICYENEDQTDAKDNLAGMCYNCGIFFCGECNVYGACTLPFLLSLLLLLLLLLLPNPSSHSLAMQR